jgi:hypothetical protein
MFKIQSFAPVNVHRFVELSAFVILCDDDCCFDVDIVLIFLLPQWCVCVCVCIHVYAHMHIAHECFCVFMFVQ